MKKIISLLLFMIFIIGCATTLPSSQRRAIESRDLEGMFDDAFKSTLQVFQDYGYVIKNSDSGVIQGETGIKQEWFSMVNFEMTATIEQFGEDTVKERLSLIKKTKTSSQYGTQESSKMVSDLELFRKLYDDIQREMFVRRNLSK